MKETELPKKLRDLWLKAISAVELKNYEFAVSLLIHVVKAEPEFLDGRKLLRSSAIEAKKGKKKFFNLSKTGFSSSKIKNAQKKDPKLALALIEEALQSNPFSVDANQSLYDCAMSLNLTDTASFALETIKKGNPKNTSYMHQLAEHYMAIDDPEKASKVYSEIMRLDPTDLDANKGNKDADARASMKRNRMESGSMRDWIRNKDEAEKLESQSRAGMTKEQTEERLVELYNAYEEDPENIELCKEIANLCEQLNKNSDALSFYNWILSLTPNDIAIDHKIRIIKDKISDQEISDIAHEIENAEDPNSEEIAAKKIKLKELQRDRNSKRISSAKARVKRNPTDPQLRFDLGLAYFMSGKFSEAIPELQRCKNNPHLHIRVMMMLGKCFANKGLFDLARKELSQASSELKVMDDTKKNVVYELGLTLEKMGKVEEALECMKEIYQVDYQYRDVAERVEQSYTSEEAEVKANQA